MHTRRNFLKKSALGASALAFGSSFSELLAATVQDGVRGVVPGVLGGLPRRFIFIRKSNGIRPDEVALPSFNSTQARLDKQKEPFEVDLDRHDLPEWLQALAPYKKNLGILQGLSSKMSENGHWSYSSVLGAFKSGRNSLSGIKRATIDFELAKLFPSPFGHVELSLTGNYSSWRTGIVPGYSAPAPHQRNYCYADPMTAYNELFKAVIDPDAVGSGNAMLRFLQNDEAYKSQVLAGYEKQKLSTHIAALEELQARNKKLSRMSGKIENHMPTIDSIHRDGGPNASTPEKQEAMTDILVAALATGLTNVVTYTIDELSTPIKGLPGNETDHISIHEIGHNGGYSGVSADHIREKIRFGHVHQVKTIADKLKAIPEGKGTMFDNTMIMYFPENGEGHHSKGTEAPFIVLGGDNCAVDLLGRYVRLPYHATEGHKTIGNWYTTLLNAHGNPIEHYGDFDLDMSRKRLHQAGAIKQFLG
ncbi:hypothetical protein DDZ13_03740 [Coraliomargarita sinensis]|uniref:DUF1552 domain-containing protein n=1 Tax=Coraliomargarita sinensis TaxID=2174842 RepID=A0A317ZN54_9BACT|nr:DUF1552 domain-containing protein [Coraliomargarita sinensis]PXA05269.1 hypothetical protein DDZ13_03740 [Coraliomargarita sinensis]